jgi:hypothetical protein
MNRVKIENLVLPKDMYVKVMPSPKTKKYAFNITHLIKQYEKESEGQLNWNVFSGGGIGASVGVVACVASNIVGISVTSPEMMTLIVLSAVFGTISGFILR